MTAILFVCTGNTCRSVMAEALARRHFGENIICRSAGLRPGSLQDTTNAIEILTTYFQIQVSNHIPRNVGDFTLGDFDFIVAMDKQVAKNLKSIPPSKLLIWNVQDPYGDDLDEYRHCAWKIYKEVARLPIPQP